MTRWIHLILVAVMAAGISGCSESIGIPYEAAVTKTEVFLKASPRDDLFQLKKHTLQEETEFAFLQGPFSKTATVFPLRVIATVAPVGEGNDSTLRVKAYQQGLFFKSNRSKFAAKWRARILHSLTSP